MKLTLVWMMIIGFGTMAVARRVANKQGRNPSVAWLLGGPLGLLVLYLTGPRRPYDPETGTFKLKGFAMDIKTGDFTINGFHYHKSAVREVKWETYHNTMGANAGGRITIVVADMQHPVHNLVFRTIFSNFDASVEQMRMLLCG
jgi:hypothetical protein